MRFIGAQPRPLAVRRTKDRAVPELVAARGVAAAAEACRALAAKELKGKVAPVKRCVRARVCVLLWVEMVVVIVF